MPATVPVSDHRRTLLRLLALGVGTWKLEWPLALPSAHAGVLARQHAAPSSSPSPSPAQLRIGYQKAAINLLVLRATGLVEQRLPATRVTWTEFPAGPQMLDAMAAGTVDFGMVGDTPPVFAQAAGQDIVYVGAEPPRPDSTAILVPWRSRIRNVESLRGRRVAVQKGSGAHYVLLRVLAQAGLQWRDIAPVYLPPDAARVAFERGEVDSRAIWDPYYAAAEIATGPRVLATAHGLEGTYAFYVATQALATGHPRSIAVLFDALVRADRLVQERRLDAVRLIASAGALPPPVVELLLRRRPASPVAPISAPAVIAQQRLADSFREQGLLKRSLRVADAVWRPADMTAAALSGG